MKSTYVLWRGPSMYDGERIRLVVTNLVSKSANTKIKNMAQVWILPDSEEKLSVIMADGRDRSYCGDCKLRWFLRKERKSNGENEGHKCYVTWIYAPNNVHRSTHGKPTELKEGLEAIKKVNKPVRVGAGGDIGAVPAPIVEKLFSAILWKEEQQSGRDT